MSRISLSKIWRNVTGRSPTPQLCAKCQEIFDNWHARETWPAHPSAKSHSSLIQLEKSGQRGCPICCILVQCIDDDAIERIRAKHADIPTTVTVQPRSLDFLPDAYLIILQFRADDYEWNHDARLQVIRADNGSKVGKVSRRTNCEENWKLAKEWLKRCPENHVACNRILIERKLPTRLLHVGMKDSELRLCLSKDLPVNTPYTTLSHCWGKIDFAMLRRSNSSEYFRKLPVDMLTKTFRDAITATRRLGFLYLWIDSLCIIQGDSEDWRHEAELMGNVYANSAVNLAADDAADGTIGCFFERTANQTYGHQVFAKASNDDKSLSKWNCAHPEFGWRLMDNNVLNSRAWVFQERLLAPRTLHLAKTEIAWECRMSTASETFPDLSVGGTLTIPGICKALDWDDEPLYSISSSWCAIIASYSKGKLTYKEDKLIAISGVSRLFAKKFGNEYLLGVWKEEMVPQITWYLRDPVHATSQPPGYNGAPSWTWITVDAAVSFTNSARTSDYTPFIDIEVISLPRAGELDPFIHIVPAYLKINCHSICRGSAHINHGSNNMIGVQISGKRQNSSQIIPDSLPLPGVLYFMPVFKGADLREMDELWGVVLESRDLKRFRRVAAFNIWGEMAIESFMTSLRGCMAEDNLEIEETHVDDKGAKFHIFNMD